MRIWGRFAAGVAIGMVIAGCAGQGVAGTGGPGTPIIGTTATQGPPIRTTIQIPDCQVPTATAVPADDQAPPTPTGSPLITITQGTNAWIASYLTQPYDIAIYPNGTAIRTEALGTLSEPLPELTIGRLDACLLHAAVGEFAALEAADLGDAGVTDQGTTTVTVHDPAGEFVLDVYALGVGDEYVTDDQRAAREQLSILIAELRDGMTQTATWIPDRVRVSLLGNPADPTRSATWRLPGTIDQALDRSHRVPCGVFADADAAAIMAELGSRPAGWSWSDGTRTVVLAIGVLVPGQECPGS